MTNVKTNSIKAWLLAARPKTLTGAAIPVMLGCALAFIYDSRRSTPSTIAFAVFSSWYIINMKE